MMIAAERDLAAFLRELEAEMKVEITTKQTARTPMIAFAQRVQEVIARKMDEHGHRYPLIYEIDEFRCIFCGYCQEVCPEEAIHVGTHFENSEYSRGRFVYDLERLSAQTHAVSTLWDPADPKGE